VYRGSLQDEEELYNSYRAPYVISDEIKEELTGGRVARKILVENLVGNGSLYRPKRR
jgi:hypothetical protein